MKKIFYIVLLLSFINCQAQSPIISLETPVFLPKTQNAYYKDVENNLSQFTGSWIYTDGNTSFKIVIQKREMALIPAGYYEDVLVGEYQYIKQGVEKVNTLSRLNTQLTDPWDYNIVGNSMRQGKTANPLCNDCADNDKKVGRLYFVDPITHLDAELFLRYIGNNQMKIYIRQKMIIVTPGNGVTTYIMTVPTGAYTMTRQ